MVTQEPLDPLLPILKRVIEPMTEAVVVIDHDGLVVAVNPSALRLLDLTDEQAALRPRVRSSSGTAASSGPRAPARTRGRRSRSPRRSR